MIFNLDQESVIGIEKQESYLGGKEFFIRGSYLNKRNSTYSGTNASFKFSCGQGYSMTIVGGQLND